MKNSSTLKIARKYAAALAALKTDEDIARDMELISECFKSGSELEKLIANPRLKTQLRLEIIDKTFAGKIQNESLQVLKLLVKRRRLNIAEFLGDAYRDAYNEQKGIARATVASASTLSQTELELIKTQLEKLLNKSVEITKSEDSSLIAGERISVAGKVIDTSIKSKLKQLKQLLK